MITAQARRGKGIDDVISGMAPAVPEQEIKQKIVGTTNVERIIEEYKKLLEMNVGWKYGRLQVSRFQEAIQQLPLCTPAEISALAYDLLEVDTKRYNPWEVANVQAGVFNHLIQESYNAGHNSFHIDLVDFTQPIRDLLNSCKGKRRRPLEVSVEGDVGDSFASESRYVRAHINGTAGRTCGKYTRNCDITAQRAWSLCGKNSFLSTFHVVEIGERVGEQALFSSFYVGTKFSRFFLDKYRSFMCSYVTENRKVFEKMKEQIRNPNKIVLIHPNGEREISWYRR